MLCHQCGSPVSKDDTTCPNCNASLEAQGASKTVKGRNFSRFTTQMRAITVDDMPLLEVGGTLAGRFAVEEFVSKGPFGQVFIGRDTEDDSKVAIKALFEKFLEEDADLETWDERLAQTIQVEHDNLIPIRGWGMDDGQAWIASDYMEGLSLAKIAKLRAGKGEVFSEDEIRALCKDVLGALISLNTIHAHGDLKPSNIYVWEESYWVSDQGLMHSLPVDVARSARSGDPFMAPRPSRRIAALHENHDVFSLGAVMSQLLFGTPKPPRAEDVEPGMEEMAQICRKATRVDPSQRYASLEELRVALGVHVEGGFVPPPPMPPQAPAGVEPTPAPEATQILDEDDLDIVEEVEDATVAAVPAAKPAPKRKPAAKKKPAPKKTKPSKAAPAAPVALAVSEDEIATMEINRSAPELGDLLPTNDLERERVPAPAEPKLQREVTKSVVAPSPAAKPPKEDERKGGPLMWMAALGVFALVIIGIMLARGSEPETVTINNDTKTVATATSPSQDPVKSLEPPKIVAPALVDAAKPTPAVTPEATPTTDPTTAPTAAEVKPTEPAKPEAQPAVVASPVKAASTPAGKTPEKSTAKASTSAKVADKGASAKPAVPAGQGTECPRGMVLVKSKKKGNHCVDRYEYPGAGRPKTNVTWFQAQKLCAGRGKRLCGLSEWRRACGSKYPRSSKWDPDRCNTQDEDEFERSLNKVGAFKACRSSSGAYDMTGNAHEWVAEKLIAGGGFDSGPNVAKCSYASRKSPSSKAGYVGFRCCADPK